MMLPISTLILLCLLFFIIATIYSSVGFGGGSSYLAVLALFVTSFLTIRSLALVCNIIVVSGSMYWFVKQGHFKLKTALPFVLASMPLAYLGASFKLTEAAFFVLLGISLIAAALLLFWQPKNSATSEKVKIYPSFFKYGLGAIIGLLSGLVGIGGGIFLAPLLHHLKWKKAITIASLACFFILVNSISGIIGLAQSNNLSLPLIECLALGGTVFLGGQIGIRFSLKKVSPQRIKQLTAILVFIVGIRVLLVNGLGLFS